MSCIANAYAMDCVSYWLSRLVITFVFFASVLSSPCTMSHRRPGRMAKAFLAAIHIVFAIYTVFQKK